MHAAFAWQRTKGLNRISQKALLLAVLCVLIATFVLLYCLYCSEWGVNPFRPDNLNGEDLRKNNKSLDTSFVFQACATKLLECAPYCLCIQSFALVVALSMPPLIEKVGTRAQCHTSSHMSSLIALQLRWSSHSTQELATRLLCLA